MNSVNYENQILDAIQRIVDNAISHAGYDKTIKGTITKVSEKETGKYLIRNQDSSFYAYSYDSNAYYSVGDMVYVLIPGNDLTQMKTIIGAVDKIGVDYLDTLDSQEIYDIIGNNVVTNTSQLGLCSYKPNGDMLTLYNVDDIESALIGVDITAIETYLKQSNYLIFGGNFQTMLDFEQKFQGNFGLAFELSFLDNNKGETVNKVYKIDVNDMTGNPYEYINSTEQFIAFQIDGENFQRINKITFFSYGFPIEDEDKTIKDIFVSNIFLKGAEKIEEEELRGNSIKLITPKGIYFDNHDIETSSRDITAQIRIDGTLLGSDSKKVNYYWFKENNNISRESDAFQRYGGIGWECLNDYNTIVEEGIQLREWIPAIDTFTVVKGDTLAKENTYKCVAVYNNIILSKEITFYNYSSEYNITIVSDSGEYFSYDVGNPTLTCYVNGEIPEDTEQIVWTYSWAAIDNNNNYSVLNETTSENTIYNNAVAAYNTLKRGLENGTILLTQETQTELVSLANLIKNYESVMRIEKNNIYKIKLNTITNFCKYICYVYKNSILVGKSSIVITNDLSKNRNAYTLVINNGDQVFKYNEKGIAPTSKSLDNVQELYPLSFTLFDDMGKEIAANAIKLKDIEWTVPTSNSLINISAIHGRPTSVDSINETATYTNYRELYFTIANIYNVNKDRNTIELKIKYKDRVIIAKTDLIFMKEGQIGTNGTDFVCRISPNAMGGTNIKYPIVTYDQNAEISDFNPVLNYTPDEDGLWFKAELWHDGIKIFDNVVSGLSTEGRQVSVKWEMLSNKYKPNYQDVSNFSVNKTTGAFTFNNLSTIEDDTLKANPANIAKCTLTYDGIDYYATMPITLVTVNNELGIQYKAELVETSGFRYAMYTTDGAKPIYDSANPFALKIYQIENNIVEDISINNMEDYSVNYDWSVKGIIYTDEWVIQPNLVEKTVYNETLEKNEKRFIPIDSCNGLNVSNALYCSITRNGNELLNIHIPIHLYLNKYGNAAMNGWDGNHIEINEDGGFILAPQIGAGKKNQDNSFTGVFMGSVKEAGQTKEEFGLYGYNAGERTIALNAEDGSARFGKSGMGQIVLDPTDNTATLKSDGYVPPVLDQDGNIITPGQGLEIDLTDPHITFGSGKFRVDNEGQVYAEGFATVADLGESVISIATEYAANDSDINPPEPSSESWSETTPMATETNKYIWTRNVMTYGNGEIVISEPLCISFYENKLIKAVTEYAGSTSSTIAPSTGWSEQKPTDTDLYVWTRVINYYSDGTSKIAVAAYCDSLTKRLQDNITEKAKEITDGLQEKGVIRIFEDKIYSMNSNNPSTATQIIRISDNGIAFAKGNNLGWNPETQNFETATWNSVWGIDGTFDAQSLTVINLNASEIQDGILELGRSAETNGKLNIYTTNGATPTIIADGSGITVNLENGGVAKITKDKGLVVTKGSNSDSDMVYGSNTNGDGFKTSILEVEKEINHGAYIKEITMTVNDNGVTHRGIGFIAME